MPCRKAGLVIWYELVPEDMSVQAVEARSQ
jgi:hypothetical protein